MRNQSAALADSTPAVTPPIVCNHPDDVAEVRAEDNFCIAVRFTDGTSGTVDMNALVHSSNAGVFAQLADSARFAQVTVELGAVTWPGGVDLAPDAMYEALRKDGIWKPE